MVEVVLQQAPIRFMGNIVHRGNTFFHHYSLNDTFLQLKSIYCVFVIRFTMNSLPSLPEHPNLPLPRSDKVMSGNVLRGLIDFPSNLASLMLVCSMVQGIIPTHYHQTVFLLKKQTYLSTFPKSKLY